MLFSYLLHPSARSLSRLSLFLGKCVSPWYAISISNRMEQRAMNNSALQYKYNVIQHYNNIIPHCMTDSLCLIYLFMYINFVSEWVCCALHTTSILCPSVPMSYIPTHDISTPNIWTTLKWTQPNGIFKNELYSFFFLFEFHLTYKIFSFNMPILFFLVFSQRNLHQKLHLFKNKTNEKNIYMHESKWNENDNNSNKTDK